MRDIYYILIRKHFSRAISELREQQELTQAEMAERLCMDERSYVNLDHGKSCCGVVTLVLFLINECPNVEVFLRELRDIFDEANDAAQKEPALSR